MSLWEQPTPLPKLNYFSRCFCVLNLSATGGCLDIADTEVCCLSKDAWNEAGWLAAIGRDPSCLLSRFPCPRSMQASFGQGCWPAEGLGHRYSTCAAPTLRLPVFLSTGNPLQDNLWETMGSLLHWWNLGSFWGFTGGRANRKFAKGYLVWHWECPDHKGAAGSPAICQVSFLLLWPWRLPAAPVLFLFPVLPERGGRAVGGGKTSLQDRPRVCRDRQLWWNRMSLHLETEQWRKVHFSVKLPSLDSRNSGFHRP